jgi:hypothetical protein
MTPSLSYGRYQNVPLSGVPDAELVKAARNAGLSAALRQAVVEELTRRGIPVPPVRPTRPA